MTFPAVTARPESELGGVGHGAAGPVADGAPVSDWLEGGSAVLDDEGGVVAISDSLRVWLGLREGEITGRPFWSLLTERCPVWSEAVRQLRANGRPLASSCLVLGQGAGRHWYDLELGQGPGGSFVRLASVLPGGAELAEMGWGEAFAGPAAAPQMFIRLLRAEAQLATLVQHWPGVVFSQRPDYSFDFVGGRLEELTGLSIAEWQQQSAHFWRVIHEADAKDLEHQWRQAGRTGVPVSSTFRVRNLKSGKVSYVLEHRQPVRGGTGLLLGYEGVWLDVTRQTLAEKLLTSAAWKETLAVLTMGLAHDFSNVMAGIHSLSESFLDQVDQDHAFRDGLGLIKKSSLQASQLVHRIVHLHLDKPGERNYHDLNQIVSELSDLARKVIPRRIELAIELSPEPLAVYVDAFEFRQVIINLALNAADAMPERGRLVLRTRRLTEAPENPRFHEVPVRVPCACLTVEDNGVGIQPAHLNLIFDPFFTTKSGGKGSGLGLYNARLFAGKHRGAIYAESQPGQGTRFHVCLPEADFTEAEAVSRVADGPAGRRGVLIYGGTGPLAASLAEILRTHGLHVGLAQSLEEAARHLTDGNYRYHGVLALLESAGLVLAPHLEGWRRLQPNLRVMVRPVGCDRDELDPSLVSVADAILTPELSPPALVEKVQEILSR